MGNLRDKYTNEEWDKMESYIFEKRIKEKQSGFFDLPKSNQTISNCNHPNHNPPQQLYIPQGKGYTHVCPACGNIIIIIPNEISFYNGL